MDSVTFEQKTLDAFSGKGKGWVKIFQQRRRQGARDTAEFKERAKENHTFAAPGEQQSPLGRSGKKRSFAMMEVNEIHPMISAMSGKQVMGRFERRYMPRREEMRRWVEHLTTYDRAFMDACHGDQEESALFRDGLCVAGVGWMRWQLDYLEDPDGRIIQEEVPVWDMLWPHGQARKKNLLDRDWHIWGTWMPIATFRAMWPDKVEKVKKAAALSTPWSNAEISGQAVSTRTPWQDLARPGGEAAGSMRWHNAKDHEVFVEYYERREPRITFFVAPPGAEPGAEAMEMNPDEFRDYLRLHVQQYGEPPVYFKKERMKYFYSWHCGDVVLEGEDGSAEIPGGRFTFEAVTAHRYSQPDGVDWRSPVDALRVPQIWNNIFLTMLAKVMQVNPKGVLFVERGVFKDRNDALRQWSSAGGVIELERGKLSQAPNPPYRFETGGPPPMGGMVNNMLSFAQEMMPRAAGFNWGAMGQLGGDLRRISGTVVEHVTEAAIAANAELYDSHALMRQRGGQILLGLLGHLQRMDPTHFERVVGPEPFMEKQVDPATGQETVVRVDPPADLFDDAVWAVSVEETKPATDRKRFIWESGMEHGAIGLLLQSGALNRTELLELVPELPEEFRKKVEARHKSEDQAMAQQQAQQQQGQVAPEGEQQNV